MSINLSSTTDTTEMIQAALGHKVTSSVEKTAEAKAEEIPAVEETQTETLDESGSSKESEGDSSDESEDKVKPKEKKGVKKRIDKLTKKLSEKQSELEYWRNEAQKRPAPSPADQHVETKADSSKKPIVDNFKTHEEYVEAVAEWKAEQKIQEREARQKESELKTQFQRQVESHQEKVRDFAKSHDDFDEVISDVDDVPMSLTIQEVILASENGPALMYELAKDKAEYKRICSLAPIAAARELGRIEARLTSDSKKEIEPQKTSKAPAPLKPVTGSTKMSAKSIYDPDISQDEFEKLRSEQLRKKK